MSRGYLIGGATLILLLWLFWPRKGVPFFQLEPIVIQVGGTDQ